MEHICKTQISLLIESKKKKKNMVKNYLIKMKMNINRRYYKLDLN